MKLHDLFAISRARFGEKGALAYESGALTYDGVLSRADLLATTLADRGLKRGDRLALYLPNRPEIVLAYLAALRLGAVVVPINLAYRRREIAHLLADAEPRLLVTEAAQRPVLDEMEDGELESVEAVLEVDDLPLAAAPLPSPVPPVDGSELALLLYTSGTTGRSKGARITHDNLLATVTGLLAAWSWRSDDRLLLTLPLFHTHGLVVGLFTALAAGATVHLQRRFDATAVAESLTGGEPPTLFFGVPTMYVRLADELARRRDAGLSHRTPGVRLYASGSAPLAPETFAAFRELTGHAILERYGMTETGMNFSNPYAGPRIPGTVGTPLPGVSARIVDGDGAPVPDGAEGELQVAGSNVCDGYWRAPDKSAEAFTTDANRRRWFRTGDLARRDPETGHVTLLGRRSELIITGGYNVYPREVEEVLESHPAVAEAAVAGLPDRDKGEVVAAWLVPADGHEPPDDATLEAYLEARLARFKHPRRWTVVDELPRNALGKVQKHRLPRG